jgi:hypothetical protein
MCGSRDYPAPAIKLSNNKIHSSSLRPLLSHFLSFFLPSQSSSLSSSSTLSFLYYLHNPSFFSLLLFSTSSCLLSPSLLYLILSSLSFSSLPHPVFSLLLFSTSSCLLSPSLLLYLNVDIWETTPPPGLTATSTLCWPAWWRRKRT